VNRRSRRYFSGRSLCLAFLLWQVVKTGSNAQKEKEIGFSEFLSDVDQGNVHDVMFIDRKCAGSSRTTRHFTPLCRRTIPTCTRSSRQRCSVRLQGHQQRHLAQWILNLAPLVLLGALWFFMIRQMQTGGNKRCRSARAGAAASMQQKKITFKDVRRG